MSGYDLWPHGDDEMPAVGEPGDDYEPVEEVMARRRQERAAAGLPDVPAGPALLYREHAADEQSASGGEPGPCR